MKRLSRIILGIVSFLIILLVGVFVLTKNANIALKPKLEAAVQGSSTEKGGAMQSLRNIFN